MKIAILGYGGQGRSAYDYWRSPENQITVCDKDESLELPGDVTKHLGPDHLKSLDQFDVIVRSPIVHPSDIVAANTPDILDKVTSVTNEFMRVCPSRNIVGVTGTKGKGTTSTLIAKILQTAGKRVHLAGNIGTPPLDILDEDIQPEDYVVLELANFQLIDLKQSPHIAVCLMVVPEHLDWHHDEAEYVTAKQQLFVHQSANDIAIYYADNPTSKQVASASPGRQIPYYAAPGALIANDTVTIQNIVTCRTDEIRLLGKHNWQNVCAAVTAVWQITQDVEAIHRAITSFSGLEHRLELVRTLDGVAYYNDSFASGAAATAAALESIPVPKVMLIGGYDRGLNLDEFAESLKKSNDSIKKVVLIGAAAQRTAEVLDAHGFDNYEIFASKDIREITKHAKQLAQAGDAVVLSPGFASFDMFKNFEERGNRFKAAVHEL
jgi:UDP-N-acetylmuramoylalanine--D-glutamate ligase